MRARTMNKSILKAFGVSDNQHLINLPQYEKHLIQKDLLKDWNDLVTLAREHGIKIAPISSYRSFEHQLKIWNLKASGKRTLLDDKEEEVPFSQFNLNKKEDALKLIHTILRWSALPGLSRHHWGSEFDLIDETIFETQPNYKTELIPSEYEEGGPFYKLGEFLQNHLKETAFFRPYQFDLGGVAREPWHISHRDYSHKMLSQITKTDYLAFLDLYGQELILRETVVDHLDSICERYVFNINHD